MWKTADGETLTIDPLNLELIQERLSELQPTEEEDERRGRARPPRPRARRPRSAGRPAASVGKIAVRARRSGALQHKRSRRKYPVFSARAGKRRWNHLITHPLGRGRYRIVDLITSATPVLNPATQTPTPPPDSAAPNDAPAPPADRGSRAPIDSGSTGGDDRPPEDSGAPEPAAGVDDPPSPEPADEPADPGADGGDQEPAAELGARANARTSAGAIVWSPPLALAEAEGRLRAARKPIAYLIVRSGARPTPIEFVTSPKAELLARQRIAGLRRARGVDQLRISFGFFSSAAGISPLIARIAACAAGHGVHGKKR